MSLGDLSYLTLLAVARLGEDAWSGAVRDELATVIGRSVTVSTVFVTLTRLEDRGHLDSASGDHPSRGGRARRLFSVTEAGWTALRETRDASEGLGAGLVGGGAR